ncbi:hypothetical protein M409DRAFT_51158 [Zasmidium cellare ATCC 36951]|uniref:Uncharacterized protein n=1 Tax=Zasmidium cellare ATCC 36951 TaxID=1080233 RepID=A0A6A6CUS0_ZASCE|nr:uncharacterized protein M409DRAFT_51158 [Zasmidium cellare ATCC 36951]KAF2170917.1 hypothetical protein M409DRAFT_51158 [Zasmidium cellare ATCC 36951]
MSINWRERGFRVAATGLVVRSAVKSVQSSRRSTAEVGKGGGGKHLRFAAGGRKGLAPAFGAIELGWGLFQRTSFPTSSLQHTRQNHLFQDQPVEAPPMSGLLVENNGHVTGGIRFLQTLLRAIRAAYSEHEPTSATPVNESTRRSVTPGPNWRLSPSGRHQLASIDASLSSSIVFHRVEFEGWNRRSSFWRRRGSM